MMYFYSSSLQKARKSAWDSSRHLYGILCFIRFVILSVAAAEAEQHPLLPPRCSVPTLSEVFSPSQDLCPVTLHKPPACLHEALANVGVGAPRVAELNETTLEKALDLVHSSNGTYMAVLYYATWCPFSKKLRPVYDTLSYVFPSIHHVAVEESSCRPSVLSQYGVHSFPILVVHNRTSRVRYHGSRTLENFVSFYQNYTGLMLEPERRSTKGEDCAFAKLVFSAGEGSKEVCPYPWAISPEKWLQDDTYLTLAILFLALRILYIVVPVMASKLKLFWNSRNNPRVPLRANYTATPSERMPSSGSSSQVAEDADLAKLGALLNSSVGGISVPGWLPPTRQISPSTASSSGSMAVGESSSSRAGPSGDVGGRIQNVDLQCLHRGAWRS